MMGFRRRRPPIPSTVLLPPCWRRHWPTTLVVTLIAIVVVCDRAGRFSQPIAVDAQARGGDWARYHDRSFAVTYVVDGDTLDIDAADGDKPVTRIRLWGVDTPEVAKSNRGEMFFGPQASGFAKDTLEGRTVHIVLAPKRTRGKYGRLLAYVFLERGGRMFNEMLLEEGYAYADRRFPHPYRDQFQDIERRARREGRGLWANVTVEQMPKWRQRYEKRAVKGGG